MHFPSISFTNYSKNFDSVNSPPCPRTLTKISMTDFDKENFDSSKHSFRSAYSPSYCITFQTLNIALSYI